MHAKKNKKKQFLKPRTAFLIMMEMSTLVTLMTDALSSQKAMELAKSKKKPPQILESALRIAMAKRESRAK